MCDGHDHRISYCCRYDKFQVDNREFYSYKLGNKGLRTCVLFDINNFAVLISDSYPCKNFTDHKIFLKMDIENYMDKLDSVILDGGFYYSKDEIVRRATSKGLNLTNNNFQCPIRKKKLTLNLKKMN